MRRERERGQRPDTILEIAACAGRALLDVHSDPWHHRSVLTLGGDDVEAAARAVAAAAVDLLDLSDHEGAHPRLGVVDVVPFVPLPRLGGGRRRGADDDLGEALAARDRFARYAADELGVPCFFYGPERSLPEVRRRAFVTEAPDAGPAVPHPSAGAMCVGARPPLVAYNCGSRRTTSTGRRRSPRRSAARRCAPSASTSGGGCRSRATSSAPIGLHAGRRLRLRGRPRAGGAGRARRPRPGRGARPRRPGPLGGARPVRGADDRGRLAERSAT